MSLVSRTLIIGAAAFGATVTETFAQQPPPAPSVSLPPLVVQPKQPAATTASARTPAKPSTGAGQALSADDAGLGQESENAQAAPGMVVGTTGLSVPATSVRVTERTLASQRPHSSDTASLIEGAPGVSIFQAGGISGLPVINGFNDDRVKVLLNGMVVTSACANHMNPPLSYADPYQIASIEVVTGVTPVSKGGDSLGGTVIVETARASFAEEGQEIRTRGSISAFYRSNMRGIGGAATAETATRNLSLGYTGAWTRADNYRDGDGNEVKSSLYEAGNHSVKLAMRNDGNLLIVQGGVQLVPYQGFPNQRMDLVDNDARFLNARYIGTLGWGTLDVRAYYQGTKHEMNFLDDKKYNRVPPRNMPMKTDGADHGYSIKAEIPLSQRDVLRVGNELHRQTLDDWWPAVPGSMMMCCNDYLTINGGERTRLGTFAEWEAKWTRAWSTLLGVRSDLVWMDTGDVHGYNNGAQFGPDAALFNSRERQRTDANWDATAVVRFEPDQNSILEFAAARKTRSPNLYERYAWSTTNQMAKNMIGWFGDGNGYIGNLDLEPEVAHTVSVTLGWHDLARTDWSLRITPYYSYVEDYIGVRYMGPSAGHPGFVNLQFANHDAELFGVNVSASMPLLTSHQLGKLALTGVIGYVHGEHAGTGASLYHMMPLNGRVALTHALGAWSSAIELELVSGKHEVDRVRRELETPGYALVNLRSSYETERWRADIGVANLFDTYYEHPLGGHYIEPTMPGHVDGVGPKGNVPGIGRSFYTGLTLKF